MKGTIKLYLCGGASCNIGKQIYDIKAADGFANIESCFIDTSLSNLLDTNSKIQEKDTYILEGVDGSGKWRKENAEDIKNNIKAILHKFTPTDMNIVMFSLSGGSGSVLGPLLVKELMSKNQTVVCVVIGSEESKISVENTVKTLQSLDHISRNQVRKPIVVSLWHNSKQTPRHENDSAIKQTITALSILASRENHELDTADVANFINFDKVTTVKEGISLLYITSKEDEAIKVEYPIALASLYSKHGSHFDNLTPEYACVGYPIHEVLKDNDLHFVISQFDIKNVFTKLSKRLEEFNESSSARIASTALGGELDRDIDLVL